MLHTLNPEKSIKTYTYIIDKLEKLGIINKNDKNGGYFYKRIVIGSLFKLGRYEEMKYIYTEIHERIFREMSFTAKFSFFSFAMLGYPRVGIFIEKIKKVIKKCYL